MTDKEIRSAMEAILFANGDSVSVTSIAQALEIKEKDVEKQADYLINEYNENERGIRIIKLEKNYQMVSSKIYISQIRKVMDLRRNVPLSQAALEVLAVVAYNQPVTKNFIEQVRGVDCSGVIGSLASKDLIEEKGRLELPGRPLLYGTTENFLRCFSVSSIDELPTLPVNGDNAQEGAVKTDEEENRQLSFFDKPEKSEENAEKGIES